MKLTIVAATGRTGQHVLEQARAAGHEVTAVVRNPSAVVAPVPVIAADLAEPDPAALQGAVAGADAVLSCLGPRTKAEAGIVSRGTGAIIDAMKAAATRRLVAISGAGVSTAPTPGRPDPRRREPGAGMWNKYVATPLARRVLGDHFRDVAIMEDLLRASGLDWTAVRLPYLTDKPMTGRYRTAADRNVRRGARLSRADAAHFMLRALEQPHTIGRAIAIAY